MAVLGELRMADKSVDKKKTAVLVKASPEWHGWFTRLAEYSRMPGVVLIDRALTEWAQRNGFEEAPPKR